MRAELFTGFNLLPQFTRVGIGVAPDAVADLLIKSEGAIRVLSQAAPFVSAKVGNHVSGGVRNDAVSMGYNFTDPFLSTGDYRIDLTKPALQMTFEASYKNPVSGNVQMEWNFDYLAIDGVTYRRPGGFSVDTITHNVQWGFNCDEFAVVSVTAPTELFKITPSLVSVSATPMLVNGALSFLDYRTILDGPNGVLTLADNLVNSQDKFSAIRARGFLNAEETTTVLWTRCQTAVTDLFLGGAEGSHNAVSQIRLYTAADSTTLIGTQRMRVDRLGNIVLGTEAALATNATDGFAYIPTCAGTPTGVPTAFTGKCAIVMDTTNHKLYVYDGSWIAMN